MASHSYDDKDLDALPDGNRTRILIVDVLGRAATLDVDDVLASCGLAARRVSPMTSVRREPADCSVALVVVPGPPTAQASVLDDIRRLNAEGFTVLCCAHGASAWPPGVLCRLLLAGGTQVLDSAGGSFARELRDQLRELLNAAAERDRERRALSQQMLMHGLVGISADMIAVFRRLVAASAVSDLPVLISGETGTGKELAAQAIHRLDVRRQGCPFVPVNCSAISAGLAESELFGHRRGAFTGADRERLGLVRAADGGVLFLDEIGDLDLQLQGKVLRVLQERRVLTVGEDREVAVDVRVVAATNRDLEDMVRRHTFRADLYHRLNVITVRMPSLRDRPDDIEPLVQHFLARSAAEPGGSPLTASREFITALRHLELPGNVRQLESLIRRAAVTCQPGATLSLRDLPPELWQELSRTETASLMPEASVSGEGAPRVNHPTPLDAVAVLDAASWKLEGALSLCEGHLVAAALGASHGNRSRAARLLGISPRCIFNKMRKHRLTA